jgi:hypothetical protein
MTFQSTPVEVVNQIESDGCTTQKAEVFEQLELQTQMLQSNPSSF